MGTWALPLPARWQLTEGLYCTGFTRFSHGNVHRSASRYNHFAAMHSVKPTGVPLTTAWERCSRRALSVPVAVLGKRCTRALTGPNRPEISAVVGSAGSPGVSAMNVPFLWSWSYTQGPFLVIPLQFPTADER